MYSNEIKNYELVGAGHLIILIFKPISNDFVIYFLSCRAFWSPMCRELLLVYLICASLVIFPCLTFSGSFLLFQHLLKLMEKTWCVTLGIKK